MHKSFTSLPLTSHLWLQGKQLYWNEYGVGGGATQDGQTKATTAQQTAATPFFGVFGQYSRENDPWELFDPDQINAPRSYLHYFFNQTVAYLNSGGVWPIECSEHTSSAAQNIFSCIAWRDLLILLLLALPKSCDASLQSASEMQMRMA